MKRIGFECGEEFLPCFDKFQSRVNQRKMFLKLFNQELPCALKFKKEDFYSCKNKNLFTIFLDKIFCLLEYDFNTSKANKKFIIDTKKTNKVNNFLKTVNKKTNIRLTRCDLCLSKKDTNIDFAINLIEYICENELSIYLDGEKSFKKFVSDRIIKKNENKTINVNHDSIDIVNEEHSFVTKIFTFWEFINSKNLDIDKHIQKAINCIKDSDFKQIYLVYPKNENFQKHISVRADEQIGNSEYQIKLIPYSLRSILR